MADFFLRNPGQSQDDDPINHWKRKIGFSEEPVQDAQGYWTIGYGQRLNDTPGGPQPYATISEPIASDELRYFAEQGGDPGTRLGAAQEQTNNIQYPVPPQNQPPQNVEPNANINNTDVVPPSLDALGFKPDGDGEKWTALQHPLDALKVQAARKQAEEEMRARYGDRNPSIVDGEADAWRHTRWNQLMTESMGTERAKEFADAHERTWVDPNPDARLMDLYNNQVGRGLPHDPKGHMDPNLALRRAMEQGYIRKTPFGK